MDVLDEKQNGAPPPMEVDEVVSVRDRKSFRFVVELEVDITASQDEAFASKHMPDLGHDVKDFTVYTWRLNNWKKLEKKLTSPEFDCGGHKWSRPFSLFHSLFYSFFRVFSKPLYQANSPFSLWKLECASK
jgi:ubiquitin carboxyl-terminal hydrolase 7